MKKHIFLSLLLIFLLFQRGFAQSSTSKGTDFWMCFMENLDLQQNGPPYFTFTVASDFNTNGTISVPATGFSSNFSVSAGQLIIISVPTTIYYPLGSETTSNLGIHVISDRPISLVAYHHRQYFSEITGVLPITELSSNYMVVAHKDDGSLNYGCSEFTILAIEDNCAVDITPKVPTLGGRPAGVTYYGSINKGEIYQVQAKGDLTGTILKERSGKKIAVFSGAKTAYVVQQPACAGADDHLYEQDYPVNAWGTEYIAVPFLNEGGDLFRVVASNDSTVLQFNCTNTKVLSAGQFFDTVLINPLSIASSKPVQLGQFNTSCSSNQNDPNFVLHKPLSFYLNSVIFNAFSEFDFNFVNIITKTSDTSLIRLDNHKTSFNLVPANSYYSFAQIGLNTGAHTIKSDSGFYAFAYGFSLHDAYAYMLGYDGYTIANNSVAIKSSTPLCKDTLISFTNIGNAPISAWNWQLGNGIFSTQQNPTNIYNHIGVYPIFLTAIDAAGCVYGDEINLQISDCATYSVSISTPNIFTPNGDGINETWQPFVMGDSALISNYDLIIYNRWGTKVFDATEIGKAWDGHTTSGIECTEGTYYFLIKYQGTENGNTGFYKLKGFINLNR